MEKKERIENAVKELLDCIGEDVEREGLLGTPDRVARMYGEIYRGYDPLQKPKITVFDNGTDGLVCEDTVVDEGGFYSMCEHHMMPFFGRYLFAYIPNARGKIIGISKVGRVVDYCAARLQVQERLTKDIADMITEALGTKEPPYGMAVILEGEHLCKTMRGVKKKGKMRTIYAYGALNTPEQRAMLLEMFNRNV